MALVTAGSILLSGCQAGAPSTGSSADEAPSVQGRPPAVAMPAPDLSGVLQSAAQDMHGAAKTVNAALPSAKTAAGRDALLDGVFDALEAARSTLPRDRFDLAAVAATVGNDPRQLHTWVRANTTSVPYRGALRGGVGVLMDRVGNSLDRSLLLYGLLRSAGHSARLAQGALPPERARQLLADIRLPPRMPDESDGFTLAVVAELSKRGLGNPAAYRGLADTIAQGRTRVMEQAALRASEQARLIAAAIADRRRPAGEDETSQTGSATEHWWVEWLDGTNWMPLDPVVEEPGTALVPRLASLQPDAAADLGSDRVHRVGIDFVIETLGRNGLEEALVLTSEFVPADVVPQTVVLRTIPLDRPQGLDAAANADPMARLKQEALAQTRWMPVLQIGSRTVEAKAFDATGVLSDPRTDLAASAGQGAANLGTRLGGLLGSRPAADPGAAGSSERQVTAAWIDYEIRSPGQAPRKIRRPIFDVLGAAARQGPAQLLELTMDDSRRLDRSLALMGETYILPLAADMPQQVVAEVLAEDLLERGRAVAQAIRATDTDDLAAAMSSESALPSRPPALYALAAARSQWSRHAANVYLDGPNLLSMHRQIRQDSSGRVSLLNGFDIVANDVAVRPGAGTDPFLIRLEHGVFDTTVEAVLAAAGCAAAARFGENCDLMANAADLYAASAEQGVAWAVIERDAAASWQRLALPADIKGLIARDTLDAIVLAPEKLLRQGDADVAAWWKIDPRTGQTVGIGPRGWGEAGTEGAQEMTLMQKVAASAGVFLAALFVCNFVTSSGGMGTGDPNCRYYSAAGAATIFIPAWLSIILLLLGAARGGVDVL